MIERVSKISLIAAMAFFMTLVAVNNLIDYGSNFEFVKHVLSMDTTFPDNRLKWRALTSPAIHHVFYAGIILWEWVSVATLWAAAVRLWSLRSASAAVFNPAKSFAVGALVFNALLWFVAFICVGGEWFLMWQSSVWNGQTAAARMFGIVSFILLFLKYPDADLPGGAPLSPTKV
jgi:predicted small integral membrane protein